jgi:hypothetical protein
VGAVSLPRLEAPASSPARKIPEAELRRRAERLRTYRLVANMIEQAVGRLLGETDLRLAQYPPYRSVARHMLGLLWRTVRSARGRKELLAAVPGVPDKLAARVEKKDPDWQRQRLDLKIATQVQACVLAWFRELLRQHPEVFPDS